MADKMFTNLNDLMKYIESQIPINLEMIGEEIKSVLRYNLLTDWYQAHLPTHYERTNQLINSLTISKAKKNGNTYEVNIFFDPDKIQSQPPAEIGYFPSYMNITDGDESWNGVPLNILVPWFVEEGQSSKIHSYEGVGMVKTTVDWANEDNYLKNRMIELLEKKGFVCV